MVGNTKKLSIAFYWHMHQPVYQLTPDSDYIMPWTRLHAVKDYLDMLTIIKNYKNIKLNFNIVPILIDSFIKNKNKRLRSALKRRQCQIEKTHKEH